MREKGRKNKKPGREPGNIQRNKIRRKNWLKSPRLYLYKGRGEIDGFSPPNYAKNARNSTLF